MASSYTLSRQILDYGKIRRKVCEKVTITWTAHTDGSFTDTSAIPLAGFVVRAVTNPGATAPTDDYDITLKDSSDGSDLDALALGLNNRDTANTEQKAPIIASAVTPVFLCGEYIFSIANNSQNGATGTIILYLVDSL